MDHGTTFVAHIDMMLQIDPPMFTDAGLNHRPCFAESMRFRCTQVWQFATLLVGSGDIIMKIEKVAGHQAQKRRNVVGCAN